MSFKIGDRVRILIDDAAGAPVKAGDFGTIVRVMTGIPRTVIEVRIDRMGYNYHFYEDHLEVVNPIPNLATSHGGCQTASTAFTPRTGYSAPPITFKGITGWSSFDGDKPCPVLFKQCECGQKGVSYAIHSDYCPLYEKLAKI